MKSQKAPGSLLPRSECSIEGSSNEELHGSSEVTEKTSKDVVVWISGLSEFKTDTYILL